MSKDELIDLIERNIIISGNVEKIEKTEIFIDGGKTPYETIPAKIKIDLVLTDFNKKEE